MEIPQINPARLPELYEAVCQLHGSLELDEVIDRTLQAAIKLTSAERAFVKLRGRYSLYAVPKLEWKTERLVEAAFEALVNDIAQNHQTLLIPDTQIDSRFAAEPLVMLFASRTLLIVPLQVPDEFLGVLIVDRPASTGLFTADELATLTFYTSWASLAIHTICMILRGEGRFVAVVSHELVYLVTSIKGFTELVLKELAGPLTERQKECLGKVLMKANSMGNLLRDLLYISRIDTRHILLQTFA